MKMPFQWEYLPFTSQEGHEIPAFRIADADGDALAETNENLPSEQQEAIAVLFTNAPALRDALEYFYNITHDLESSLEKGYIEHAQKTARAVLAATSAYKGV